MVNSTTALHPNVAILEDFSKLLPQKIADAKDLIAEDFVWHFFNFRLPEMAGDYMGLSGLQDFFTALAQLTDGTFEANPILAIPMGDELVVTHVRDRMVLDGEAIELDAVVVWRIVAGQIAEAWDIPSLYLVRQSELT
ncbi:MAG: nuclear transport factor 2 family protein [Cyanothece sp. SIO2G6]|nr:nuclear transport factor 2 family protein [Cyanothece sp. SIO2G6]